MTEQYIDHETGFKHGDKLSEGYWFHSWTGEWKWYNARRGNYLFRASPVPHTGKSRYGNRFYRHPNIRRLLRDRELAWFEGWKYDVKGKSRIFDPYDDIPRARHQNWKHYRKQQYK